MTLSIPLTPLCRRTVACLMLLGLALAWPLRLLAQGAPPLRFQAKAERTKVQVGEPFTFTLSLEYTGRQMGQQPTPPDFGGLMIRSGPSLSNQIYSDGRGVRFVSGYTWELVAPREGEYTIGAAQLTTDQVYQTQPVAISASAQPPPDLPKGLQGGASAVAMARTGNASIDPQLRGRLFLRAVASNPRPYVGEPVVVTYLLFNAGVELVRASQQAAPDVPGAVAEELFNASQIQFRTETHDGRSYQVAEMYRVAVMPNQPGQLTVQAYSMNGVLRAPGRRGGDAFDPFNMLDDPFFGGGIQVELASPLLTLDVQPLPSAQAPAGWSGTIGDYKLAGTLDRTAATEDDLLTWRVTLEGRGAVDQAGKPTLPTQWDFEVVGESQQTQKQPSAEMPGGRKTFEYVLRPRRPGKLELPTLHYPVFNPWSGRFDNLEAPGLEVLIAAGKHGGALPAGSPGTPAASGSGGAAPSGVTPLGAGSQPKSIGDFTFNRPDVLFDSASYWTPQVALAGLLLVAWRRDRRRAAFDPAQERRGRAWRRFGKRIAHVHQLAQAPLRPGSPAPAEQAAAELERAVFGLVADKFNLSAEGLTIRELEQRLQGASLSPERVERLLALLESCAAIRYAPAATGASEVEAWANECATILREGLK